MSKFKLWGLRRVNAYILHRSKLAMRNGSLRSVRPINEVYRRSSGRSMNYCHCPRTSLIALAAWSAMTSALAADAATDHAQVREQSASIPAVHRAAAAALGVAPPRVDVRSRAHRFTVSVVDVPNSNASSRYHDAQTVVGAVERAIGGRRGFDHVMLTQIDFVTRTGKSALIVEGFDFNRSPSGSFALHTT